MRYCQKHNVGLVGDVECDQCVYGERDGYRAALNRIVTEPHTRVYLVDIADGALRFFAPNYQPKP